MMNDIGYCNKHDCPQDTCECDEYPNETIDEFIYRRVTQT